MPCFYSYLAGANGGTTALVSGVTYSGYSSAAYTYSYDVRGNITAVYKNGTLQASYVYDDLNQLTRENNVTAGKTWVYTYDRRGNILSRKTYAYTTGTLGTAQDTDTYEYFEQSSEYLWGDGLLRYDGTDYNVYDAIGNPLSYNNGSAYTFSWQNGRQLASGTKGSTSFAYTYNADGLRTKKVVNGVTTEYYWAGSQLAMMIVNPDLSTKKVLKFYYDAEGRPIYFDLNGTIYFYVTNLQGDVVALTDSYGEVVSYQYDAWGKPITTDYISSAVYNAMYYNPLRYRGYIYDNETGFYYLQSRYYDPTVGRFINTDSALYNQLLGFNLYVYCLNNPVNYVDESGRNAEALKTWSASMWWLCLIDTSLPIGDIIYGIGCGFWFLMMLSQPLDSVPNQLDSLDDIAFDEQTSPDDRPKDEKGNIIVVPDEPPRKEDGYRAPKDGPVEGKTKGGKKGWRDKNGNIWVPAPTGSRNAHGGGHWDVTRPDDKGYVNVYPGGKTRPGHGKIPIF